MESTETTKTTKEYTSEQVTELNEELMDALGSLAHAVRHQARCRKGRGWFPGGPDEPLDKKTADETVDLNAQDNAGGEKTNEFEAPQAQDTPGSPRCAELGEKGGPQWHGPHGHGMCNHGPHMGPCGMGHGGPGRSSHRAPLDRERVLMLIEATGPLSQRKLAELLGIRPQSLSESLAKLEKDGFISREKSADDKRKILVSLTETGEERSKEVEEARNAERSKFLEPLAIEERAQLLDLIDKLLCREDDKIN